MKYTDDTIKRILTLMKVKTEKIIKEDTTPEPTRTPDGKSMAPEVTVTANKEQKKTPTEPGNKKTFSDKNKIINCNDGRFLYSSSMFAEPYVPLTAQEWYDREVSYFENGMSNLLSACEYYASMLLYQYENKIGNYGTVGKDYPKPNYNEQVQVCIKGASAVERALPPGCSYKITYISGSENYILYYTGKSWFKSEYKKFMADENHLVLSPAIVQKPSYYAMVLDNFETREVSVTDLAQTEKEESSVNVSYFSSESGDNYQVTELPITKEEAALLEENPITMTGEFKEGEMICKKPDASFINLRTSAQVNTDTGYFDPIDNYIDWTSATIIGKYLGEFTSNPAPFSKIGDDLRKSYEDFLSKITIEEWKTIAKNQQSIDPNTHLVSDRNHKKYKCPAVLANKNQYGMFERNGIEHYLECPNDPSRYDDAHKAMVAVINSTKTKDILPENVYKNLPNSFKPMLWYNVGLPKNFLDMSEIGRNIEDIYSTAWVRSDNARKCPSPKAADADTTYLSEFFRRVPIKPLKDPGDTSHQQELPGKSAKASAKDFFDGFATGSVFGGATGLAGGIYNMYKR